MSKCPCCKSEPDDENSFLCGSEYNSHGFDQTEDCLIAQQDLDIERLELRVKELELELVRRGKQR